MNLVQQSESGHSPLLGHVETLAAALPSPGGERVDRLPLPQGTRRSA